MIHTFILNRLALANALNLTSIASKTTPEKGTKEQTLVALLFDPSSDTCTIKSHSINGAKMIVTLELELSDIEEPLWLEVDGTFIKDNLTKFKHSTSIKLEIDTKLSRMYLIGGKLHEADMVSEEKYFVKGKKRLKFDPVVKILNTMSNYDFEIETHHLPQVTFHLQCKQILAQLSGLIYSLKIDENGVIALFAEGNKLIAFSTNFYIELPSKVFDMNFKAFFGGRSFDIFEQIVDATPQHRRLETSLYIESDKILIGSQNSVSTFVTKSLCELPSARALPNFDPDNIVMIDVKASIEALNQVNSKQKESEDIVRILVKKDDSRFLAFEVDCNLGHLASQVCLHSPHTNPGFEVRAERAPLLAAMRVFLQTDTVHFVGLENDTDYFFVSNEKRTQYIAFKKLF